MEYLLIAVAVLLALFAMVMSAREVKSEMQNTWQLIKAQQLPVRRACEVLDSSLRTGGEELTVELSDKFYRHAERR